MTLEFDSYFDIEWEVDYGFVLATTDAGANYTSLPNIEGYTIASDNPFGSSCHGKFGNGLTGTRRSYEEGGDPEGDRASGTQTPGTQFLPLTFDLTDLAPRPQRTAPLPFGSHTTPMSVSPARGGSSTTSAS